MKTACKIGEISLPVTTPLTYMKYEELKQGSAHMFQQNATLLLLLLLLLSLRNANFQGKKATGSHQFIA